MNMKASSPLEEVDHSFREFLLRAEEQHSETHTAPDEILRSLNYLILDRHPTQRVRRIESIPYQASEFLVDRPDVTDAIISSLLLGEQLVALTGMSGSGKSTEAYVVTQSQLIKERFENGVIWVSLGSETINLTSKLMTALVAVEEDPKSGSEIEEIQAALRQALQDRAYLIVLDDVWDQYQLEVFRNVISSIQHFF
ncbi:MAG: hypothetical protein IPK19_29865 [Chloroflexi bacterium]|nr:hypothetical protein [Chloroflexota bacterium]